MRGILLLLTFICSLNAAASSVAEQAAAAVGYTIIYADEQGETHFKQSDIPVVLSDYAPPAIPLAVSAVQAATGVAFLALPPGWFGDWHPAPRAQFIFCLEGRVEVQVSDGELRQFQAGDIVYVEDLSGKGHTTRSIGTERALLAAVPVPQA